MARPVSNTSCVNFVFEISQISKLDEVWSPEYIVQGTPWEVGIYKKTVEEKQWLAIFFRAKKEIPPNWTHVAWASFKLLPFSDNQNAIEHHTEPLMFDGRGTGFGTHTFIEWDSLFDSKNDYVKNDTIKIDIKIEAEPLNQINKSSLKFETLDRSGASGCQTTFRITVFNINNLMAVRSPEFVLQNLSWDLTVCKTRSSHLSIISFCNSFPNETPCETKMAVKLRTNKTDVKPITQINFFCPKSSRIETNRFLTWDKLITLENGFVKNNSITLEVKMICSVTDSEDEAWDEDKGQKIECVICCECIINQNVSCTPCGHLFCTPCISRTIENQKICPSCRPEITLDSLRRLYLPL